ncbi:MAG: hypothetical protein L6Q98_04610 [Anaerolineae bacterium]|nr:hypothetical protein [Anaerolineae bacterium]NUQ03508.1 hypothetical protein [Anaerolineae bacterium]
MRFLVSFLIALLIGIGIGLYLGRVQFPVEVTDSPMSSLAPLYRDDYAVMIALAYAADRDLAGALDRLRLLEVENVAQFIQDTTERFISTSRSVSDVRALVTLAEGVGRLTPIMEPYRQVGATG